MDIVSDIIARIRTDPPRDEQSLAELESALREEYGGSHSYIGVTPEDEQRARIARHRQILRDWQAGEKVALIARRYGLSRRRVYQIIREYS